MATITRLRLVIVGRIDSPHKIVGVPPLLTIDDNND